MSPAASDLLRVVIEPIVTAEGLDLEELDVALVGRRRRVKVVVDGDGGVDLDRCAALSRVISDELDRSDVTGDESYTLEVSSRGVSRPLTESRHWRRNVGRLARVAFTAGGELTGRIRSATDASAVVDVAGEEREVRYSEVAKAKILVEFRRADDGAAGEGGR